MLCFLCKRLDLCSNYRIYNHHCGELYIRFIRRQNKNHLLILIFRVKGVSTGGIRVAVWISATPDRQPIGGASPRVSRQPSNGPMGGPTFSAEKNTTDSMINCLWYVCVRRNMVRVILGYIILSSRLSDD